MLTMKFYEEFMERQIKNFNKRKNNQFEKRVSYYELMGKRVRTAAQAIILRFTIIDIFVYKWLFLVNKDNLINILI